MYGRTIANGAPPHGAEKDEGDHRCPCMRAWLLRPVNSPPAFGQEVPPAAGGVRRPLETVDQLGDGDLGRVVHREEEVSRSPLNSSSSASKSSQTLSVISWRRVSISSSNTTRRCELEHICSFRM